MHDAPSSKKTFPWRVVVLIVLAIGVGVLITQTSVRSYLDPGTLRDGLRMLGVWGPVVFMLGYAVATAAFLPGTPFTVAGGYVYGPFWGTVYTVFGATLGAMLGFLVARYVAGAQVHAFVKKRLPGVHGLYDTLEKKGFVTVLVLRLLPIFPFSGLNYALGLTPVTFKAYTLATLVGIIPFTFVYSYFGNALGGGTIVGVVVAVLLIVLATAIVTLIKKSRRPKGDSHFDVIVIGAGSGGLNIASFMHRIGSRVLLIDKSDASIGGDCLNFGCVPSKALIHLAAEVRASRSAAKELGLQISGEPDMKQVAKKIQEAQEVFRPHENAAYFRKKGIRVELAPASFAGPKEVRVGASVFSGERIVLATGSRPRRLQVPGSDQVKIWTNEEIFSNTVLPKHLVVIGGGPIGMEIASAYEGFGSKVTVINRGNQLLGKEDAEIAATLERTCKQRGMDIYHEAEVVRFEGEKTIVFKTKEGAETALSFDMVFAAIGRELNVEGLNLEAGQIQTNDRGGVVVDAYLRTSNKNVYVCGDVAGMHQFTHAAELHASTIIKNLLSPFKKPLKTDHLSWVTFTSPEVATFGRSEETLKQQGVRYEVLRDDFLEDDRAITDQYPVSLAKLFVDPKGHILGGTMIAPGAGEITQELMLAAAKHLRLGDLFAKVYPYPTASRINRRMAGAYLGRKLTPKTARLLRVLMNICS